MKRWLAMLIVGLGMAAAGCDSGSETASPAASASSAPPEYRLAVIPKGTTHVYWKSVEAGALAAAEEMNVEIVYKGPLKENDRAQQIAIVEQFVSEGISGIVLAPLDDTALQRPVADAMGKNIPVVIIDSGLKGEAGRDFVSFVATDNRQGGVIAGEHLASLLEGKGKVVLLRYLEGSASTTEREAGFLEVMARHPGIEVIVDNRYGGPTAGDAKTTSLDLLDRLKEADGIFASNEPTVFGMLLALRQNNLAGKIKFVGFDASPQLIEAMQKGEIQGLVVQNPVKMGYEGVAAMVRHLKGESVDPRIDTGVRLVTTPDLEDEEVKALLGME